MNSKANEIPERLDLYADGKRYVQVIDREAIPEGVGVLWGEFTEFTLDDVESNAVVIPLSSRINALCQVDSSKPAYAYCEQTIRGNVYKTTVHIDDCNCFSRLLMGKPENRAGNHSVLLERTSDGKTFMTVG